METGGDHGTGDRAADAPPKKGRAEGMLPKFLTGAKFLTVVDTYEGYCQVCFEPHVVGRIAVAGWGHQGTICSRCLSLLADEVQRRAKSVSSEKAGTNGHSIALAVIGGGNGNGHMPETLSAS